MKILHLGKKNNVENHTKNMEYLENVTIIDLPINEPVESIISQGGDADYIIVDAIGEVGEELINNMPNLKMIHSEGVGFNRINLKAAKNKNVYVCNCEGMNAVAVAEQTLLLMLGVLRDVKSGDIAVRSGKQQLVKENYMVKGNLYEIADFKVGLVGFGHIAKALARLLNVLGVSVYYYSRHRADKEVEIEYNVEYLPLEELCCTCKMISLHIPVTAETTNMFNEHLFSLMPKGSYLINTARGEVVDSKALIEAMKSGIILKAGLDTIAGEPVQVDNIMVNLPEELENRILFSPHIGGITNSSFMRGYEMIWQNVLRMEKGTKPERIVNEL